MTTSYLVVTDLDGTLLDHHSYSWQPARESLALLKAQAIPLVLCSSKTAAEMQALREELALDAPYIVENGAAVYLPMDDGNTDSHGFGRNRTEVLEILHGIREAGAFAFTGFSDMNVSQVMAATGLDEAAAVNALQREFTEPLLWQDTDASKKQFLKRLHQAGLDAVEGGRFMHVSAGCDKGRAVDWLRRWYQAKHDAPAVVIALGDSDNDVTMLEGADLPVLVRSPVKEFPAVKNSHAYQTEGMGPEGWNEAIINILETQDGK